MKLNYTTKILTSQPYELKYRFAGQKISQQ